MTKHDVNVERGVKGFVTRPPKPSIAPTASPLQAKHPIATGSPAYKPIVKISLKLSNARPFPQANSLAKVAGVVDAVSETADTDEGIAIAIGVVPRQGSYYANAAAYLGLITEVDGSPRAWGLTAQGILFLESDGRTRTDMLTELVSGMPAALAASGNQTHDVASSEDLADSTADRRVAALNAWMNTLTSEDSDSVLSLERDEIRGRIPDAAKAVAATRAKFKLANSDKPLDICSKCFTAKSLTGVCSCY